jgi:NADH dehydrogenase [ubiquinone] 1 alpha subcomplex assembly factor 7
MSIESKIRALIQKKGFLPLDEVIESAMSRYSKSYYRTHQPLGEEGDFTTSPEVSQMFGEMIGVWCVDMWNQLGKPSKCNIVEYGSGLGTLMRDMLRTIQKSKEFFDSINVWIVDINPILKEKQYQILKDFGANIKWVNGIYDVPEVPTIIIANEFFDALPIKQYVKQKAEWKENVVVVDPMGGNLAFDVRGVKRILEQQLIFEHKNAGDGAVLEESPASIKIVKAISEHIEAHKGAALIIDYGYDIASKFRKSYQYTQTLQAIKQHKYVPILPEIGEADLSSHVDFWALKNASSLSKVQIYGSISQKKLLMKCGVDIRFRNLVHKNPDMFDILNAQYNRLVGVDQMGELFKAIAITSSDKIVPLGFQS